jgi:hypothetical protein
VQTEVLFNYNIENVINLSTLQSITITKYCNETKSMNNFTIKSPDMLAPARIPVAAGKKMENTEKKL